MSPHGGSGGTNNLGTLQVTFSSQGLDALQKGIAELQKAFASVGLAAQQAGDKGMRFMEALTIAGRSAGSVFGTLKDTVGGFVRAGLNASAAGQVISIQMEQLSREIASLFIPAIEKVIDLLGKAVQWFRGLSGEQQESLGRWLLWTAGLSGAVMLLPRIIAGVQGLTVAGKALHVVLTGVSSLFTRSAWGAPLAILAGLIAASLEWKDALAALEGVAEGLISVFGRVKDEVLEIVESLKGVADKLREVIGLQGEAGREKASDWIEQLDLMGANRALWQKAGVKSELVNILTTPMTGGPALLARWFGLTESGRGSALANAVKHMPPKKQHRTLGPRLGGVTDLNRYYERLAEASIKMTSGLSTKTPAEESAETLKEIKALLGEALGEVRGKPPLIARK